MIVSARDKDLAARLAREVANSAPQAERIRVLGPAEAPITVIRGRYRWRLLSRAPRDVDIQTYLREWLARVPAVKGDVRLTVDIDPYNFL